MPDPNDRDYHAERARQEGVRALAAPSPAAAAIHQELCLRYSSKVIAALVQRAVARP